MNAYALVVIGKEKQGIDSDRAYAIQNGLTVQNISDWKAGRSSPNAANFLKLAISAGMTIHEALEYAEKLDSPKRLKQAGFSTLEFMVTTVGMGIVGVSLLSVTSSHGALLSAALGGAITAGYTLCEVI